MKIKAGYQGLPLKVLAFGILIQALTILGVFLLVIVTTSKSYAMGLKPNNTIESDVITLGDVFYDLPRDAGKVLGPSPRPGSEMVLDAKTLTRVALALNLPWRPATGAESISLRRAATLIEADTVKSVIKKAMIEKGFPGKFEIIISAGDADIILPQSQPASFDLTDLKFDLEKKTFKAAIAAPTAANALVKNEVSGSIEQIVSVPVLRDSLSHGEIISARDIETIDVPGRQVGGKTMLRPEDIIGMTPRRTVLAGTPLSKEDLSAPQLVQRGKNVIMTYRRGPLVLTAQGKALGNAAKGDTVRVINASTNRSIDAIAVAENEVEIKTF